MSCCDCSLELLGVKSPDLYELLLLFSRATWSKVTGPI